MLSLFHPSEFWSESDIPRPNYTHHTIHQTLLGKALFEHGRNYQNIATVAVVSPSILNSSLGPNLSALIPLHSTFGVQLFTKVFSPSSTLQFTPHLSTSDSLLLPLLQTPYFAKNVQSLKLSTLALKNPVDLTQFAPTMSNLRRLEVTRCKSFQEVIPLSFLNFLPNLEYLHYIGLCPDDFDASLFEGLGNSRKLTRLTLDVGGFESFPHDVCDRVAFRSHFCNRFIRGNTTLKVLNCRNFDTLELTQEDKNAFKAAADDGLVNLEECEMFGDDPMLIAASFPCLKKLTMTRVQAPDFILILNQCSRLESLECRVTTEFTCEVLKKLTSWGGATLRSLNLSIPATNNRRSEQNDLVAAGAGFSKLKSLTCLDLGSCYDEFLVHALLQNIPGNELVSLDSSRCALNEGSVVAISKFVKLEHLNFFVDDTRIHKFLPQLGSLVNLTSLTAKVGDFFTTPAGVEMISQLHNLKAFDVGSSRYYYSYLHIKAILEINSSIEEIDFNKYQIRSAADFLRKNTMLAMLETQFPNVQIDGNFFSEMELPVDEEEENRRRQREE